MSLPRPRQCPALWVATAVAVAVAAVFLVTAVVPAEYGADPLATARWLGPTEITATRLAPAESTRSAGAALNPSLTGPVATAPAQTAEGHLKVVAGAGGK